MESTDLAFYTSQELIDELVRRKTFMGVVVHAEKEVRGQEWSGETIFKVRFNSNLDAARASRLLDTIAEYIDLYYEDEERG